MIPASYLDDSPPTCCNGATGVRGTTQPGRRARTAALALLVALALGGCVDDRTLEAPSPCGLGWVVVPEGPFIMGIEPDDPRLAPYGISLQHIREIEVQMSAYCMERTEVSVAKYRECVEAGVCEPPNYLTSHPGDDCNYSLEPGPREHLPVNCLSWDRARRYCQAWRGGDLPSEAQWEKAARGTDGRLFPWGDKLPDCRHANYDENGEWYEDTNHGAGYGCDHQWAPSTWEVGHLDNGRGDSPYGLRDMAGNVAEYTRDCIDPGLYERCLRDDCRDPVNLEPVAIDPLGPVCVHLTRGGSSAGGALSLESFSGGGGDSENGDAGSGFRCVKPVPE